MRTMRLALAAAFSLLMLTGCPGSPKDSTIPPVPKPDYGANALYVANSGNNTVSVIDPQSYKILDTIAVGNEPVAIAQCSTVNNDVYVANKMSGTVSVIDDTTDKVVQTIGVGKNPSSLVCGSNEVVATNSGDGSLSVISMATNAVSETDTLGTHLPYLILNNIIFAGELGDVLTANSDNTITVLDSHKHFTITQTLTARGRITGMKGSDVGWLYGSAYYTAATATQNLFVTLNGGAGLSYYEGSVINLPHMPLGGLASARGVNNFAALLAIDSNDNKVTQISYDPATGITAGKDFAVGRTPVDATSDVSQTFVANSGDDTISVLDSTTGTLKQTIALASGAIPIKVLWGFNKKFETGAATPTPAPVVTPAATPTPAPTPTPTAAPTTAPQSQYMYVANEYGNNVLKFAPPYSATSTPVATITYPSGTHDIVTDGHGTTAVLANSSAYFYNGTLTSTSTPFATVYLGGVGHGAFDSSGNFYATSFGTAVYKIAKPFTNSSTASVMFVADRTGTGMALDASNAMYIANAQSGFIDLVTPPYANNSETKYGPPASGADLVGLALHGNQLFVSDDLASKIYVYNLPLTPTAAPAFSFSAASPLGIAFDANGSLYVTDGAQNQVEIFNPPFSSSTSMAYAITGSFFNAPSGVGFAP